MTLDHPWTTAPAPGDVVTVAPGIGWLRMPLPFQLNHINLWLLDDGAGWTIVDTGVGRVPPHSGGRGAADGGAHVGGVHGGRPRAGARVPVGPRRRRPDLRRSSSPEDHDQRLHLARAADRESAPSLPRLAPTLRADGARHARAALARAPVPRTACAPRAAARPSRGATR